MRFSLLLLALFVACAPSGERAQQRQALPMLPSTPVLVGRAADSRLGESVAGCRFPGFVAGSPGDNFAALAIGLDGGTPFWLALPFASMVPDTQGVFSVCEGTKSQWIAVSGSNGGLFIYPWTTVNSGYSGVRSLTRSNQVSPAWVAFGIAERPHVDRQVITDAGQHTTDSWTLRGDGGFGAALALSPDDAIIAVTDDETSVVQLFDARSRAPGLAFQGPRDAGFGASVVMGDVHPNSGVEVLVSASKTRQVFILGKSGTGLVELMRVGPFGLLPNSPSEPLPVVIEPGPLVRGGTMHAFWVGVPELDSLHRFVGDAGEHVEMLGPIRFGTSLSVTENTLVIGAPGYEPDMNGGLAARGAVYLLPLGTQSLLAGDAQECDVSEPCVTSQCVEGTCVGGVLCLPTAAPPLCPAAECRFGDCLSLPDAGTDAGVDAGVDAGSPDAGERDAGVSDAGVVAVDAGLIAVDAGVKPGVQKFSACGCSSGGLASTSMLALIIVALARRRG